MALLGNQLTIMEGCVMMKTRKINVSCIDHVFAHHPANNDEYQLLTAILESCGLEKNLNSVCDESWQAWRFNPDGTSYLEFHSIWFDDMEREG